MALKIYTEANPDSDLSIEGSFENPLALTFDGVNGGVIEKRLYVRNDELSNEYTGITLVPQDAGVQHITDGDLGYSWKLYAGDQRPLEEQWSLVEAGNEISLSDLSDTTTYLPFWIRVEIPAGAPVTSFQSASLVLEATETISP